MRPADASRRRLCPGRVIAMLTMTFGLGLAHAGIPEPSVVLYGSVFVDGQQVRSTDDVTILGRVDGVPQPVGSYHMGDRPPAGDSYVLPLRIESLADGRPPSDDAAILGQTVRLLVRVATGEERAAGSYVLTRSGAIEARDLVVDSRCTGGETLTAGCDVYVVSAEAANGVPGQSVTFHLDGGSERVKLFNNRGRATVTWSEVPPGAHVVTADLPCQVTLTADTVCDLVCTGSEKIRKASCADRDGALVLTVVLVNGAPGDTYFAELTSGESKSGTLSARGKAKMKFKNRSAGEGGAVNVTWGCGAADSRDYQCP